MSPQERPGPAFIALRAAVLGIDDESRQALRSWVGDALDHRGELKSEPEPIEPATRTIAAAIMTLSDSQRRTFRFWLLRWTAYTGRVITPFEQQRRLEAIRKSALSGEKG